MSVSWVANLNETTANFEKVLGSRGANSAAGCQRSYLGRIAIGFQLTRMLQYGILPSAPSPDERPPEGQDELRFNGHPRNERLFDACV